MKNGQIFAHKSTARGSLDLEYLDETSRRKVLLRERADMDQPIGKRLKYFTDYVSKETLGQVHAGGFLHHSIRMNPDGTSTAPFQLSNAERKHRITETWRKHLAKFSSSAKRPVIAHRLVFSMSKEQHDTQFNRRATVSTADSVDAAANSRVVAFHRPVNGTIAYKHIVKVFAGGRAVSEQEAIDMARSNATRFSLDMDQLEMKVATNADHAARAQRVDARTGEFVVSPDELTEFPRRRID